MFIGNFPYGFVAVLNINKMELVKFEQKHSLTQKQNQNEATESPVKPKAYLVKPKNFDSFKVTPGMSSDNLKLLLDPKNGGLLLYNVLSDTPPFIISLYDEGVESSARVEIKLPKQTTTFTADKSVDKFKGEARKMPADPKTNSLCN